MPIHSSYPPIVCPAIDLWEFVFSNADRDFSNEHGSLNHPVLTNKLVVYVDIAAKKKFTFHDVRATAEQFGQALLCEWAWRKGDTLALITPNFADVASVMFGTLYAGGVVCPLNHLSTSGELARSLEASNAKAMVTSSSCLDVAQEAARIVGISHDRILLIDEAISQGTLQHFSKLRSPLQTLVRPQIDPDEDLAFLVRLWATLSDWDKPIGSTGRPAPNMSLKIMQDGREMQCGEEGELWIRGPNIFKGYYRDTRATTAAIDAEGWYRSGDIGYFDKHDNIFITDRLKELIKYNGYQVPPAQLEALLIGHPAVLDVAVIGAYSEEKATELPRAYIVLVEGHKAGTKMQEDLHQWLNKQVVPYKRLRGGIRFVDAIPKSTAGKILRRVLVEQARKEQAAASLKSHL
ncbi:hypothetical protein E4T50_05926 [Aureobasidium sp. EXF-12298]|nr:hypothetical protein E4T50_05926 [Aureobasidium sp. EXF-12298]